MNPLALNGWEIFLTIIGLVHLILLVVAIFRVGFDKWLTPEHRVLLLLASILIPVIGPVFSLLITLKTNKR